MSLEAILQAIHLSGERQVQEIIRCAVEQANALLADAQLEAQKIEEDVCAKEVMPAYQERARIIHQARSESLRIVGNAREILLDKALDRARGYLAGLRSDPEYPMVLRRLVLETLAELKESLEDIQRSQLEADPRDRQLIEQIMGDPQPNLSVEYRLECWGGVIARSSDGRVVIINTLEARFSRAAPFLRRYLAALFENQEVQDKRNQQIVRKMIPEERKA
jgi:vacuolar-type H+-ATPase subunit E/Vma4